MSIVPKSYQFLERSQHLVGNRLLDLKIECRIPNDSIEIPHHDLNNPITGKLIRRIIGEFDGWRGDNHIFLRPNLAEGRKGSALHEGFLNQDKTGRIMPLLLGGASCVNRMFSPVLVARFSTRMLSGRHAKVDRKLGKMFRLRLSIHPGCQRADVAAENQQRSPSIEEQLGAVDGDAWIVATEHQHAIGFDERVSQPVIVPDYLGQFIDVVTHLISPLDWFLGRKNRRPIGRRFWLLN